MERIPHHYIIIKKNQRQKTKNATQIKRQKFRRNGVGKHKDNKITPEKFIQEQMPRLPTPFTSNKRGELET